MTNPMMPRGVEHTIAIEAASNPQGMTNPMMPRGVEHVECYVGLFAGDDQSYDAERR